MWKIYKVTTVGRLLTLKNSIHPSIHPSNSSLHPSLTLTIYSNNNRKKQQKCSSKPSSSSWPAPSPPSMPTPSNGASRATSPVLVPADLLDTVAFPTTAWLASTAALVLKQVMEAVSVYLLLVRQILTSFANQAPFFCLARWEKREDLIYLVRKLGSQTGGSGERPGKCPSAVFQYLQ